MSRNTTIELLNATDRIQARLDWQLFCHENDRVVYGDGSGWQPGEPLFAKPSRSIFRLVQGEQWIRHMLEEIDEFEDLTEPLMYGYCHHCCVGWMHLADSCWVCYRRVEGPETRSDYMWRIRGGFRAHLERELQELVENDAEEDAAIEAEVMAILRQPPTITIAATSFKELEERAMRIARIYRDFGEAALSAAARINDGFAAAMGRAFETIREGERIAFDVETFEWPAFEVPTFNSESFEEQAMQWRAANRFMFGMQAQTSRPISFTGRMRGPRSHFVILDEGLVLMSPTVEVTVDDVTIEIPRNWRQTKTPPAPQSDNRVLDHIVTQHKLRFPQFYRTSNNTYDRRVHS